ncbi:hypothetical protein CORC01_08698 [Colletotrichum orchidophilum]|uniref:Uncharacterized protein n=1 Tax=Colletotrichum orchidophilum TaxID=1209926 RepID=A0A1G4B3V5_9PEZI|nr:uncharacterized protein CORC01_08698 [Colletotrichum orchidophilum]OHE96005.1 hypothetical protein CORC01_08698 [Colletotrichum orchidophilum]
MLLQPTQIVALALGLLSATAVAAPAEQLEARQQQPKEVGACYDTQFACDFQGCFADFGCDQISGGTAWCCRNG